MGACQKRLGPNTVGYLGLIQPLTDGVKLIFKEIIVPNSSSPILFLASPFFFFGIALLNWFIIPFNSDLSIGEISGGGVLFTIVLSELSILGILYAGYSSNSKYSLLGSLRAIAQCISYGITMTLAILCILVLIGDVDYLVIFNSNASTPLLLTLFPVAIILIISTVSELGRPPFDL